MTQRVINRISRFRDIRNGVRLSERVAVKAARAADLETSTNRGERRLDDIIFSAIDIDKGGLIDAVGHASFVE
jgi:hypothetical protein